MKRPTPSGITVARQILILLLLTSPIFLPAQLTTDFTPLRDAASNRSPAGYNALAEKKELVRKNKQLSKKEANAYYSRMCFLKEQLFCSGAVYLQNDLTKLVDSITDRLLETRQHLKKELKVFVTRFSEPNAICFPDGTIFFNTGMIALTKSETELAFVLAHEMAHYTEQHSIKDLKRLKTIQTEETESSWRGTNDLFRSLRFSRESEFAADAWALALLAEAGYNVTEAPGILTTLKNRHLAETMDLKKLLSTNLITVDTAWYGPATLQRNKRNFNGNKSDPIASERLDDLFSSHPDLGKREEAAKHIAGSIRGRQTKTQLRSFEKIREIASFEQINSSLFEENYLNALERSLEALKKYPDNAWLHQCVARSLYWLSYYKEVTQEDMSVFANGNQNTDNFFAIYSLIMQIPLKDLKKMAYGYTTTQAESFPKHDGLQFYHALSSELYLGKSAARINYLDYTRQFPQGNYINYSKKKLQ